MTSERDGTTATLVDRARRLPSRRVVVLLSIALVAGALVLVAMLWLLRTHRVSGIDRRGFSVLGGTRGDWLAHLGHPLETIAPLLLGAAVLATLVALVRLRAWLPTIVIVAGPPICLVVAHLAKAHERRPRPHGSLVFAGGFAFPSTDSAVAVTALAVGIAAAQLVDGRRARIVLVAIGVLATLAAGLLFVALRVHYPTDVIAGWALGVVVFSACTLATTAVLAAWRRR